MNETGATKRGNARALASSILLESTSRVAVMHLHRESLAKPDDVAEAGVPDEIAELRARIAERLGAVRRVLDARERGVGGRSEC
jgi:hypothetical protein